MFSTFRSAAALMQMILQQVAIAAVALSALALTGYALACAAGEADWLVLPLQFGDIVVPQAGIAVQLGITGLFVLLCFFLPMNARVMALENSHRRFHIGMQDVARAYAAAHAADREGVFSMSSEFDSIRERIAFLRDHPDLTELETPILEVAAQMSHISRELAQVYSDRNVARARDFLIARQQEIEDFNARLDNAKGVLSEMRPWLDRIEIDEQVARAQLDRLCDALAEVLPEILPDEAEPPERAAEPAAAPHYGPEELDDIAENDPQIVKLLARRAAE
ncbi:DNA repair protein [Aestuariicoccus sp. MJ-SS9]|uniref:DNA repair protein n=1 Tax=Aestuariicoccus sp. MJ-SS9 TaxID=3079855 RepID=UPI00290E489D|nr:DNA repair protein [Aestuariicoccus sp. MJ-SS9]MDU8911244.1 DNA repair protein [Aestuariicoccus sp. MJ-SS9]